MDIFELRFYVDGTDYEAVMTVKSNDYSLAEGIGNSIASGISISVYDEITCSTRHKTAYCSVSEVTE